MRRSFLTLVTIAGAALSALAQVPNGGFESWDSSVTAGSKRVYSPVNWSTPNEYMESLGLPQPVSLTRDAYAGQFAVKIVAVPDPDGNANGFMTSGNSLSLDWTGDAGEKFPITGRIRTFEGYYKYLPATGNDSFMVYLAFYRDGAYVGRAYHKGGASAAYQRFQLALTYPESVEPPDSGKFFITSSTISNSAGSILFLDNLSVGYNRVGTPEITKRKAKISVFPNPAERNISVGGDVPKEALYEIVNTSGETVREGELEETNTIATDDLSNGTYLLKITSEGAEQTTRFVK